MYHVSCIGWVMIPCALNHVYGMGLARLIFPPYFQHQELGYEQIGEVSELCVNVCAYRHLWLYDCLRVCVCVCVRARLWGHSYVNNNSLHRVNCAVSSHYLLFPWLCM